MKKTISTFILAVFAFGIAKNVEAKDYRTYVGVDYSITELNTNTGDYKPHEISANLGVMYNKNFGTELFYQYSNGYQKFIPNTPVKIKIDNQAYGLDVFGYLPIAKVNLIATAGIAEYKFKTKFLQLNQSYHFSGYGYRFGVGASYNVSDKTSLRIIYRYINFDKFGDDLSHGNELSVGFRYGF